MADENDRTLREYAAQLREHGSRLDRAEEDLRGLRSLHAKLTEYQGQRRTMHAQLIDDVKVYALGTNEKLDSVVNRLDERSKSAFFGLTGAKADRLLLWVMALTMLGTTLGADTVTRLVTTLSKIL